MFQAVMVAVVGLRSEIRESWAGPECSHTVAGGHGRPSAPGELMSAAAGRGQAPDY